MNRYPHGLPEDICFIKVIGENGIFYDLVNKWNARKHLTALKDEHYKAMIVSTKNVPPCIARDFTDSLQKYVEITYKNGTDFYHI